MILGSDREQVIENICSAVQDEDYYRKVEINDPVLTDKECREITDRFMTTRNTATYRRRQFAARQIANIGSSLLNHSLEIIGEEKLPDLSNGVLITSNHFSPLENTLIRYLIRRHGKKQLQVVSQVTNFAMTGVIGFLMNYADTIPLRDDFHYLTHEFLPVLEELIRNKEVILIYPEQEMWFQYRKPRPLKRGAYYFAAKLNVPVISCFVEMIDTEKQECPQFRKVRYRLHVLGTLYPDPTQSVKISSEALCRQDYALKKAAYEAAYSKPLNYEFHPSDIAGWCQSP